MAAGLVLRHAKRHWPKPCFVSRALVSCSFDGILAILVSARGVGIYLVVWPTLPSTLSCSDLSINNSKRTHSLEQINVVRTHQKWGRSGPSTAPRSTVQDEHMPQSSELRPDIVVGRPAFPRRGFYLHRICCSSDVCRIQHASARDSLRQGTHRIVAKDVRDFARRKREARMPEKRNFVLGRNRRENAAQGVALECWITDKPFHIF